MGVIGDNTQQGLGKSLEYTHWIFRPEKRSHENSRR